jgi:polysaccharide export outer membrane protein
MISPALAWVGGRSMLRFPWLVAAVGMLVAALPAAAQEKPAESPPGKSPSAPPVPPPAPRQDPAQPARDEPAPGAPRSEDPKGAETRPDDARGPDAPPKPDGKAPERGRPSDAAKHADPTKIDLGSYRLRVEDAVEITVYNPGSLEAELRRPVVVPGNGQISFPPIGRVELLGRTTFEIEEDIAQKLKDQNYLKNPNVGCFVVRYAPRSVSLMGAITGTVELPVHRDLRILELMSRAGAGAGAEADLAHVEIRRIGNDGTPFKIPVNLEDVFQRNDEKKNVVVKEGDIVYTPRLEGATPISADWVYVIGKVTTPGRHPIVKGPTPFTLVKLISICGDFSEFANRSKIKVIRATETGRQYFTIDFDDIIEGERPDFDMKPDDIVYVPESLL